MTTDIFNTDNCDTGYNYAGETLATVEHDGFTFTLSLEHDSDHGAPWDKECGHGPVTDWIAREKLPGELVLNDDGRSKRYYDFAEACRIARRDGWGAPMYKQSIEHGAPTGGLVRLCSQWFIGTELHTHESDWTDEIDLTDYIAAHEAMRASYPSARAYAAAAARADYDHLRDWCDWCDDKWSYVGAVVTVSRNGIELASASLWGIESTAGAYFCEVGNELAGEALAEALVEG